MRTCSAAASKRPVSRFYSRTWMPAVILAVCGMCMVGVSRGADSKSPTGARRTAAQIFADINTTVAGLSRYPLETQLDPLYKEQMKLTFSGPDQHLVDLITEMEKVSPRDGARLRSDKCLLLVYLAIFGNADGAKSLTEFSRSAVPADAILGKVGLMAIKWWSSADAATQKDIVTEFEVLAKANPNDDVLLSAALTMARYRCGSDDLASSLRDIAERDLKGPAAVKYQKQPMKIGRPFKISVKTTAGSTLSTADWKGKVVLIDFWATWCPPCRGALPGLIKLYQENHPKGLEVLGISNDSSLPELKKFVLGYAGMVWPESFNPTGANGWNALSAKMEVTAIPTTFLIDRNGNLRDIEVGSLNEDLVKKLLDETAKPDAADSAKVPAGTAPAAQDPSAAATGATPPAAPASPSDPKANALMSLANNYIALKRTDLAKDKLKELLRKYPDSAAATKAKGLLEQLEGQ